MIDSGPVRRRWLDVDGRLLHRLDFGGTGRPAVCLHGVTSCAWIWHHVARNLGAAGHPGPIVACDLRGHGDSGWAGPGEYRTADHASDLAAVLATMGAGPVDLVGSSWGGLVGLALAADRPDLVHRLVLVDIEPSSDQSETLASPRPGHFAGLEEAAASWRTANPSAPEGLVRLLAAAASRPGGGGGRVPLHDPVFLRRWPFRSEDWWPALDAIAAPTLVISAEHSWVRADVCDQMADRLSRGHRMNLPGTTHVVPVDAPAALAGALSRFLAH